MTKRFPRFIRRSSRFYRGAKAGLLIWVLCAICVIGGSAPARAAVQVETGTFVLNTGSATTTVTTGFQGKAVILFTHGKTGLTETAGASWSIGISDGTNLRCFSWSGDDAVATTNVGRGYRTAHALEVFTNGTPTNAGEASGVAFNATPNMVITWTSTPGAAYEVSYILFGGADITNVAVGDTSLPAGAGTLNVTSPGFQGNFLFTIFGHRPDSDTEPNVHVGIGAATGATKRWAWSCGATDGANTSGTVYGKSKLRNDVVLTSQNTIGEDDAAADFTQWTSSGFDLNVTQTQSGLKLAHLVIKGGQWDVGTQAKPSSAATQTVTGMAFQPKLLGYLLSSPTALNTYTANAVSTFGAATSASARAYAGSYHNDAINTVAKSAGSNALMSHEMNATANMDFTSFNADGWTGTWSASGTAFLSGWFAATDNAAAGGSKATISGAGSVSGAGQIN